MGMVSVSPHNSPGSPPGYVNGEKYFYGFGHKHLSGIGCADLGSIILTAVKISISVSLDGYKTSCKNESAEQGYYSLFLDQLKLRAEVTAPARCGITKFSSDSLDFFLSIFRFRLGKTSDR
jgi:putative alpha-1,2-mannosidase